MVGSKSEIKIGGGILTNVDIGTTKVVVDWSAEACDGGGPTVLECCVFGGISGMSRSLACPVRV